MAASGLPSFKDLLMVRVQSCVQDSIATGDSVQVSVDGSSWVLVSVSQSVLQLAIRASRQTSSPLHCLLLGSVFISKEEGVVIEVDRFDMGRTVDSCLQPTAVVPGDVVVYCTVSAERSFPSTSLAVAELQRILLSSAGSLDPSNLLYLQIYITTHLPDSGNDLFLSCQCVHPSSSTLTPICDLPIVHTALARNLAGPLSLPILQDTFRWGYLTMEVTRKLVLLLNSDPKSVCAPLVGVWVSGVCTVTHPMVWAAVLHYRHTRVLKEKTQPSLFEFTNCGIENQQFTCCIAQRDLQLCAGFPSISLELVPSQLLATKFSVDPEDVTNLNASADSSQSSIKQSMVPLPCPLPVLARDSRLSCVSLMDKDRTRSCLPSCAKSSEGTSAGGRASQASLSSPLLLEPSFPVTVFHKKQTISQPLQNKEDIIRQQEQRLRTVQLQLSELLAAHNTPTAEIGINTGESLLQPNMVGETSVNTSCVPQGASVDTSGMPWETSVVTSGTSCTATHHVQGPEETSVATSLGVSIAAETSLHASGSISLDLCSFAPSDLCGGSTASEKWTCKGARNTGLTEEKEETGLLQNSRQRFYQNMLAQVQELLQISDSDKHEMTLCRTPLEGHTLSLDEEVSTQHTNKEADVSIVPVPHILKLDTICESTLDEETHTADMIAMKYIGPLNSTTCDESDVIQNQLSVATNNYLHRHHLQPNQEATQILDVKRLRTLPKLI